MTTEDIQMEETREKIELFRNYYLVCFRSFDQDPYSQTHLEPLNMYIIVFREGTLSVRRRLFLSSPFTPRAGRVLTFFLFPLFLSFFCSASPSSTSEELLTLKTSVVELSSSRTTSPSRRTGSPTLSSTTSPMRLDRSFRASSTRSTVSMSWC